MSYQPRRSGEVEDGKTVGKEKVEPAEGVEMGPRPGPDFGQGNKGQDGIREPSASQLPRGSGPGGKEAGDFLSPTRESNAGLFYVSEYWPTGPLFVRLRFHRLASS